MSDVYAINEEGIATVLQQVHCKNEDRELQELLENNLDLLPGDQISPDNPRRWVMIRREMPVPDPTSGANRWSIDFLLADQDAIPTFVECKRHDDSRARREIVGQMLEYVANGHYYWSAAELMKFAEEAASTKNRSIGSIIASFGPSWVGNVESYFNDVETNLREGNVKMVFVLEDSSYELRSVVDFLNDQMKRAEVLLVELRQYDVAGERIVVPTLFGYSEKARMIKRDTSVPSPAGARRSWDEASFMDDALKKVTTDQADSIRRVISASDDQAWDVKWGTGKENGSLSIRIPGVAKRSLVTVYSNGSLTLNFGWLNENATEERTRDSLASFAAQCFQVEIPSNYREKYVSVPPGVWGPKVEKLIEFICGVKAGA